MFTIPDLARLQGQEFHDQAMLCDSVTGLWTFTALGTGTVGLP